MALTRRDIIVLGVLACLAAGVALIRQTASPPLAAHDTAIRKVISQQRPLQSLAQLGIEHHRLIAAFLVQHTLPRNLKGCRCGIVY